jgi:ATP-binding cassette subfamily G (WHITE) protein 5 (sterolin 1)
LKDITAHFKSKQLTGILGSSGKFQPPSLKGVAFIFNRQHFVTGSGKSSFLDLIAGRLTGSGRTAGTVKLDGEMLTPVNFQKNGGYVIQMDRLLANLTVHETLMYSAQLHSVKDSTRDNAEVKKRVLYKLWFIKNEDYFSVSCNFQVHSVIVDLGLSHVQDALVGGVILRGISGGERRRVSIAVQLLQDPRESGALFLRTVLEVSS